MAEKQNDTKAQAAADKSKETNTGAAPLNAEKPLIADERGDLVDAETLPVADRRVIPTQGVQGSPLPPEANPDYNADEPKPVKTSPVVVKVLQRAYTQEGRLVEPGDIITYNLPAGEDLPGVFEEYRAPSAQGE